MGPKFYRDMEPGRLQGWGSGFKEGVRFSPVEVYNPQDAPTDRKYAVFSDNKRMMHRQEGQSDHPYKAVKSGDRIIVACGFPFYSCSYAFAEDVRRQYISTPDEYLLKTLDAVRRDIASVGELPEHLRSRFSGSDSARESLRREERLLEALAGKHRSSIPDMVGLFERIGPEYLADMPLPVDAQLIPLNR
jgi:hypothetical protein